jgi:DNA-binding NtrC family response regulator
MKTGEKHRNDLGQGPKVIGQSAAFQRILKLVGQVAPTDRAVLVSGPSGCGKEVIAQLVHSSGRGAGHPLVDINCGAIPEHLVESELFGCVRGAFTGAITNRLGHFEAVGSGTLFLDEIGELPLALQPKLLRVLETRSFRPVGSNENRRFDGRIIAATHRDLKALVRDGRFREDLYYRLAVFELEIPGLDQRREDIPELVEFFSRNLSRPLIFTQAALVRLSEQAWPGNARQLRNLVDRLSILADSQEISIEVLQPFLQIPQRQGSERGNLAESLLRLEGKDKLAAAEQLLIDYAVQHSNGNKTAAAQMLGVGRKVIERRQKLKEDRLQVLQAQLEQAHVLANRSEFQSAIKILQ